MSNDILSQDEVDALLKGVTGEEDTQEVADDEESVRRYDIGRQERIVVKLHRGNKASVDHYLQVALDLKLSDQKINEKIKQYLPVIQHEVMLILSSKEFDWLDDVDHKKKLAIEIRDKINKIIRAEAPADGVKAVYFSSFILQ